MKPNSDAAILRGEEIETVIDKIKELNQQRGDLLESIADCISDDEYDNLAWGLTDD